MTGIGATLERTRAEGRAALIGYLPAGFPDIDGAVAAAHAMVDGGVDGVEIGLPYSDPLLDGPTIQAAVGAALRGGVRTADVLDTVAHVAPRAPTLVMSYWNPIQRYGVDRFAQALSAVGGAGVITADVIPDEAADWVAASDRHQLDRVFLIAPSSTDLRIAATARACRGFVYVAAVMGVTGARDQVSAAARILTGRARAVTDLPLCVGLGVSSGTQAAQVARYADGVIVGSAFVQRLLDARSTSAGLAAVETLARELADGVRSARPEPVS